VSDRCTVGSVDPQYPQGKKERHLFVSLVNSQNPQGASADVRPSPASADSIGRPYSSRLGPHGIA
jgi:hypothetical protein